MFVSKSTLRLAALASAAALALAGCASATESGDATGSTAAPGKGTKAVGFIMVGPKDDFGYNQAVYEGSQVIKKEFPNLQVLTAENVPEDDTAATHLFSHCEYGNGIFPQR